MEIELKKVRIDKDILKLFGVAPLAFYRTNKEFNINSSYLEFLVMFYHLQVSRKPGYAVSHEDIMNYSDGDPNYAMIKELQNRGWLHVYGVVNGKRFYRITTEGIRIARFFLRNLEALYTSL